MSPNKQFYHTSQFAKKASVSVRTLRYYDQQGILSPTKYSESGYRQYSDEDFVNLQYILGLKYLGFSLEEIRVCMGSESVQLKDMLAQQKSMMRERRNQLNTIIAAIEQAERVVETDECDWDAITQVIRVVQMDQKKDWVNNYFTPEQQQKMKELSDMSYSEAGKKSFEGVVWTEEDQKKVDAQYAALYKELTRLVSIGANPESPEAQAAAKMQIDLLQAFTQGNPERVAGLKKFWENFNKLPDAEKPPIPRPSQEEQALLNTAMAIYRANQKIE